MATGGLAAGFARRNLLRPRAPTSEDPGRRTGVFSFLGPGVHPAEWEVAMVVVMKSTATDEDIERVVDKVREAAGDAFVSRGKTRTIIGLVGDTAAFMAMPLPTLPGVDHVVQVGKPYKLVARESHPHPSTVKIGPAAVGRGQLSVIARLC